MMKPIEKRGRTLDALLNPKNYAPFPGISDADSFRSAWRKHPDWMFANMAHAAYVDDGFNQALFAQLGAIVKPYTSKADHKGVIKGRQAILVSWDRVAIVSFRGTEGSEQLAIRTPDFISNVAGFFGVELPAQLKSFLATDIVDDLNFPKVHYQKAEVHSGFLDATMDIWPQIKADLKSQPIVDCEELYVTGHSLGAAMAVIAGMTHKFRKIVTFGEPRVGKDVGKNDFAASTPHIRYVNGNDPVTTIVPTIFPFSFEHHGEERKISDPKKNDNNMLFDHSIINYAQILGDG